jgi:hypothetical protein
MLIFHILLTTLGYTFDLLSTGHRQIDTEFQKLFNNVLINQLRILASLLSSMELLPPGRGLYKVDDATGPFTLLANSAQSLAARNTVSVFLSPLHTIAPNNKE